MKRLKNTAAWLLSKAVLIGLLWLALFEHVNGAWNVAMAWMWLMAVLSMLAFSEAGQAALLKDTNAMFVPQGARSLLNILILVALIWCGEWALAVPFSLSWLFLSVAKFSADQDAAKKAAAA